MQCSVRIVFRNNSWSCSQNWLAQTLWRVIFPENLIPSQLIKKFASLWNRRVMNPFQRFAICCVLNHFSLGKSTPFFFKANYSIFFYLCFSVTLKYSDESFAQFIFHMRAICLDHLIFNEIMPWLYLMASAKLLSCLLCSFFNFSIFTSPRPLRFWVLQIKLIMKAGSNCCRECPNELIIITMSLNKYVMLEDKVFCHFWEGNSDSASPG